MKLKGILVLIWLVATAIGGQTVAQPVESEGERAGSAPTQLQLCPYECTPGQQIYLWQAVTTLQLLKPHPTSGVGAELVFFNGNGNIIARSKGFLNLLGKDMDEVNICRSLKAAGIPVPEAGQVVSFHVFSYLWTKTLVGEFFTFVDEPRRGKIAGIAKTECRIVPPSVVAGPDFNSDPEYQAAPLIDLVLVADTADD